MVYGTKLYGNGIFRGNSWQQIAIEFRNISKACYLNGFPCGWSACIGVVFLSVLFNNPRLCIREL